MADSDGSESVVSADSGGAGTESTEAGGASAAIPDRPYKVNVTEEDPEWLTSLYRYHDLTKDGDLVAWSASKEKSKWNTVRRLSSCHPCKIKDPKKTHMCIKKTQNGQFCGHFFALSSRKKGQVQQHLVAGEHKKDDTPKSKQIDTTRPRSRPCLRQTHRHTPKLVVSTALLSNVAALTNKGARRCDGLVCLREDARERQRLPSPIGTSGTCVQGIQ
jgi:hypothetical protein